MKKGIHESIKNNKHPTYIINLQERVERRVHIKKNFENHPEFDLFFFDAIKHNVGSQGLYESVKAIIKNAKKRNLDYVIICEDDHVFTETYDSKILYSTIEKSRVLKCDVLLGGISNVHDVFFLDEQLVWLGGFTGLQFSVFFKDFFDDFLKLNLMIGKNLDLELGKISDNIYACYPPLSKQVSFGYSDITSKNNSRDVNELFERSKMKLDRLCKISRYFNLL